MLRTSIQCAENVAKGLSLMHEVIKITDVVVSQGFNQLCAWTSQQLKSLWLGQGSLSNHNENEGVKKKTKMQDKVTASCICCKRFGNQRTYQRNKEYQRQKFLDER